MAVAAYPVAKIGLLLLKQLSKPLANLIKNEAKKHPQIRKYVIVPTGKAFIWAESSVVRSIKGANAVEKEISEEDAIETGANALGEIILFGLLVIILLLEYNRQSDKKAVIERMKADEVANLQDLLLEVIDDVEKLKKTVRDIELDLMTASDALSFEEKIHSEVHDYNFWDTFITKDRSRSNIDLDSPSNL